MAATQLTVSGTGWRPSFLSFLIVSRNNLNPGLSFDESGLHIKVVKTTSVPWSEVDAVSVHTGFKTIYCVITADSSEFVVHFREHDDLAVLIRELHRRKIATEVPPQIASKVGV